MARKPRKRREDEDDEEEDEGTGILVKVARTGGLVKEVALNGGRTVEDAIDAAEMEYSSRDRIRIDGEPADLDDELEDGNIVTLTGKVKGGGKV